MSTISTHVLDTAAGRPAAGVPVRLELQTGTGGWVTLAQGATDGNGRRELIPEGSKLDVGRYRLTFDTGTYFTGRGEAGFFPEVAVAFEIRNADERYHVPLLLSPFGYSTYRGS
jgi:5-hydroxyisourate hydrolase